MPVHRIPKPSHGFVSDAELEHQYFGGEGWKTVPVEGDGSLPDPFLVIGTDPGQDTVEIRAPVGQAERILEIDIDDGAGGDHSLFSIGCPGGGGLQYGPNPANSASFQYRDDGQLLLEDNDGDGYLAYTPGNKTLDLDPVNGQVSVLGGFLRLAASGEPADASLPFNGCFILYIDGSDLKAKAKIGGNFVHATLGTFT